MSLDPIPRIWISIFLAIAGVLIVIEAGGQNSVAYGLAGIAFLGSFGLLMRFVSSTYPQGCWMIRVLENVRRALAFEPLLPRKAESGRCRQPPENRVSLRP